MYKNYENRVKDFINDMMTPSNQIKIEDRTTKVDNPRFELLNELKVERKPFIFKGYLSEKDRIQDIVKKNKLLYNLPDYPEKKRANSKTQESETPEKKKEIHYNFNIENKRILSPQSEQRKNITSLNESTNNPNISEAIHKNRGRRLSITEKKVYTDLARRGSVIQPEMRFRARTDLERVYDNLEEKYKKDKEKEIVAQQLKNIDLYDYKDPKELLSLENSPIVNNIKKHKVSFSLDAKSEKHRKCKPIYGPCKIYYEANKNNDKIGARRQDINQGAKGILHSYHYKTHFKATEEIAEYKTKNKNKLKETCFLLPHLCPKNYQPCRNNTNKNLFKEYQNFTKKNNNKGYKIPIDYSKVIDTRNIFRFEEDEEGGEAFDTLDELQNENNPISFQRKLTIEPESMEQIKKLAFSPDISEEYFKGGIFDKYKKKNKKENQNKNGEEESNGGLVNNINSVARLVLGECNLYSPKSKFNNTSLKARSGKTMITNGLSIKEFGKKYGLNV